MANSSISYESDENSLYFSKHFHVFFDFPPKIFNDKYNQLYTSLSFFNLENNFIHNGFGLVQLFPIEKHENRKTETRCMKKGVRKTCFC